MKSPFQEVKNELETFLWVTEELINRREARYPTLEFAVERARNTLNKFKQEDFHEES